MRPDDGGEAGAQVVTISRVSSTERVVWGDEGRAFSSRGRKARASLSVSDQRDRAGGQLAMVPTTSGWRAWPTRTHLTATLVMDPAPMHLGYQRAGGVEGEESCGPAPRPARIFGTPWAEKITARRCRESRRVPPRRWRPWPLPVHHESGCGRSRADIDRRAVDLQRLLDRVDGANDAGAEARAASRAGLSAGASTQGSPVRTARFGERPACQGKVVTNSPLRRAGEAHADGRRRRSHGA